MNEKLTWLALGDSYTIGESCPIHESFPYQSVQLLREAGKPFNAPEIVAKTGWTTTELASQMNRLTLAPPYDIATLLIGVNNQYRGLSASQYALEFEELLKAAFRNARHVFVLSIPDWSLTPFAAGRDRSVISEEIAAFNSLNSKVSRMHGATYVDITTGSPESAQNPEYLAADGLHPSGRAYSRWAKVLTNNILNSLKEEDKSS